MLIRTRNETHTTVTLTETYDLGHGFELTVVTVNGKRVEQIISKQGRTPRRPGGEFHYLLNAEEFRTRLKVTPYYEEDKSNKTYWFYPYIDQDPFTTINNEGFKLEKVILNESSSHNFRDANDEYLAICIVLDYIGGFKENDRYNRYEWEPVKAYLKTHPNVLEIEEFPIPYYNSDFHGQRGLRVKMTMLPEWRSTGQNAWNEEGAIFSNRDPLGILKFKIKVDND